LIAEAALTPREDMADAVAAARTTMPEAKLALRLCGRPSDVPPADRFAQIG